MTTDSGVAIVGAQVISTRAPDRAVRSAETQTDGHFEIVWQEGRGDYLIHIVAVGRKTFRQRVTRTGSDSVLIVNAKLSPSVQQITPVTVEAKPRLTRDNTYGVEAGASEKFLDGVMSVVPVDQIGDLNAAAATVPGVSSLVGGISVLGLDPSQNSTTLNGMPLAGLAIPADVRTRTRITTTTYDPARGWFSGANTNVELPPASLISYFRSHATIDAPSLQATDRVSSVLGQQYTNLQIGFGGEGPVDDADRYFYNFGLQGSRRSSPRVSLLDVPSDILGRAGVAPDSLDRFLSILSAANIPTVPKPVPSTNVTENVTVLLRVDRAPYNWKTFTPARRTWGITAYGNFTRSDALRMGPTLLTALPSQNGRRYDQTASLQSMYSFYFGNDWLQDFRSSFTTSHVRQTPDLRLTDAHVLVTSEFAGGRSATADLTFGGNAALFNKTRQSTWETTSETQFYRGGRAAHRVKLNVDSRLDWVFRDAPGNTLGSYAYNSLSDLAGNQPTRFTRSVGRTARAGVWNGFIAIGDLWRATRSVQILYGMRAEANVFSDRPAYNAEVHREFGARTDEVPNTWHLSPRFGFTWNRRGGGPRIRESPIGVFNLGPSSYVRGGFGEFRSMLSPFLLSEAIRFTGNPGESRRLTCFGAAVPIPDWNALWSDLNAVPSDCIGGATQLVDDAPTVETFAHDYAAPRSWRANLVYSSTLSKLSYTLETVYSINLNQPSFDDLNFLGVPQFILTDEGRPIFVSARSIVSPGAIVSPVEGRKVPGFGRVLRNRSDLRSVTRQATLTLMPDLTKIGRGWYLAGSYTLSGVRSQLRGFDASTFGDPRTREWGRGALDARHQFQLQAGYVVKDVGMSLFARAMSGLPFTPLVRSDINGDGLANDRAFIFNPLQVTDSAFAAEIHNLSGSLPSRLRGCIEKPMGAPAKRNGCEGPWTASVNAQLSVRGSKFNIPRVTNVVINFANVLGGFDQLLHGSNHLRGWGSTGISDAVLYNVRGFDSAAQRFKYQVNGRFGSTRPAEVALREPFRVTLSFNVALGADVAHQQLDRVLRPGRNGRPGPRLSVDELKKRYSRYVPSPYPSILVESDSLLLTREQSEGIRRADASLGQRMDSLWTELATYFASLPEKYDVSEALARQEAATDAGWEITWRDAHTVLPSILSPIQLGLMPGLAKTLVEMKTPPKRWPSFGFGP